MDVQKVTIQIGLIIGTSILLSCSTYKNGFLLPLPAHSPNTEILQPNLSQLTERKEELNNETNKIISNMKQTPHTNKAIHAADINHLFENLHNQYLVDQEFQSVFNSASNDSLKTQAWQNLIQSSDFYNHSLQQEKYLRRILNRGNTSYDIKKNTLMRSQKFLWNSRNRKTSREEHLQLQSQTQKKYRFIREKGQDKLFNTFYKIAGFGSFLFGRISGSIHAKARPEENIEKLMPQLHKWDIVCQKSIKRLTDKFIPGYFGHAGIYLGDSIFVEVIQRGVVCSSPKKFLEGNAFIVIRPEINEEGQAIRMENLLKIQLGKKYDYNFNVESPDRLICTELIYLVFDQIDWETRKTAGRFTISPDDLVKTSLENNELEIPFYFDQKELVENPDRGFVEKLLKQK